MTKMLLLRVYLDTNQFYGGYYSPIHDNGCITFLPIKETHQLREIPSHLNAIKIIDKCTNMQLSMFYPREWVINNKLAVHNDPRLDLGFYTGHYAPIGRIPRRLARNDYILFMAGLAKYRAGFWDKPRSKSEIIKAFKEAKDKGNAGIYIVAYIKVNDIVEIKNWLQAIKKYPNLKYSPHYYWEDTQRITVAVIGESNYIIPPIKIFDLKEKKPTRVLVDLIGKENTVRLIKNNFRKSRLIIMDSEQIENLIESLK